MTSLLAMYGSIDRPPRAARTVYSYRTASSGVKVRERQLKLHWLDLMVNLIIKTPLLS